MERTRYCNYLSLLTVWLVFWLCILLTSPLAAQESAEQYADSLLNSARQAPTSELKIEGLLKVSIFWSDRDTTRAYQYLREARRQMGKSPTDFQKGLYRLYHGNILMEYNIDEAKAQFLLADSLLSLNKTVKSYFYRSKLWNNYGVILQKEDRGDEFMKVIVNKALPYARLAGDSTAVGYQLHNMGMQLANIQNYTKAANYYEAAIHTMRSLSDKYENRLEIFTHAARNALFLKDFDTARNYLDSAKLLMTYIPHSVFIPTFYRTELAYYRHIKNKEKALQTYHKGISSAEKLGDEYMLRDINFELYAFYRDLGEYQKAKKYLMLSDSYEPFTITQNRALYHGEMAKLEYQLANYKAAYLQMDSLNTELKIIYEKDLAGKILDLEQQYKSTEKENRILRLEATNHDQKLKIAQNRWWGLVLSAASILALCIALFSWKINKKNKKVFSQRELLHQNELHAIRQQERLREYDAMLQGQEAERNRLARDLHDGLGGLLAGVKLKLSSVITRMGGSISNDKGAINDVIHQLDYSVDELRRIAHNMMPESLRYGGLIPALSDLCRYMDTPQVQVKFENLNLKDNYHNQLRITVYRIVQELLTNAVKHSNASKVILQCSELDNWLFITVEDNGKGMETTVETSGKGLGLLNIRNRIALLNGSIETQSNFGEGTTFNIQVPL